MEWTEQDLEIMTTLEELSGEQEENANMGKFLPPKPKKFPPLNLYPNIDLYVKLVSKEFGEIPSKVVKDNLSADQRKALKELKGMRDIIIKPADKGGNIFIQSTKMHEKEAFRQLRDTSCYRRLTFNPTLTFQGELHDILEKAYQEGVITKELRSNLIPMYPKLACIYFTPKIHKNMTTPPGRPIVSGNGSLCETIGKYLDSYLKPLVCNLPSYIRDTGDVLGRIDGIPMEDDMWLVSLDVESLYTAIQHHHGILAVESFLQMMDIDRDLIHFLLDLLKFVLEHNYFIFKEIIYVQQRGTAMGAAFAPSYANLFMGSWERQIFFVNPIAYIEKVLFWVRFIDDILMVWQGSEQDLLTFLDILNNNTMNIKLTCKYSQVSLDFLDIQITKGSDGLLETNVFRKDTAVNSLLHASSSHPKSLIEGIPTGQFIRIKRICSNEKKKFPNRRTTCHLDLRTGPIQGIVLREDSTRRRD
ncbi:unnamed protein product [Ranitomeya imitator]|uniref:Reverse transcriptase domain-containing protein n=1 Tax=Ranitomeya imitator TaxID=111125 RepID=A0ABN9MBD6_9NEOB|nr:unnamed protein product [Ranitomeya imitator]